MRIESWLKLIVNGEKGCMIQYKCLDCHKTTVIRSASVRLQVYKVCCGVIDNKNKSSSTAGAVQVEANLKKNILVIICILDSKNVAKVF